MNSRMMTALMVALAIAAVGCGGDDDSSRSATPTPIPATSTPQPTATAMPPATATATVVDTVAPTSTPANPTPPPTSTPIPTSTPTSTPTTGIEACYETTLDASLCDPETASFTLETTNPYYPLAPGLRVVLEGEEDGESIRVERTVLEETEMVNGVETHVLEHKEFIDGEIHEIARNFYVEADDGTVCYFGEDVEFFEDGEPAGTEGSWRAGVDGAEPGIIMAADPAVGDAYFQENAPGIAIDMGRVSDTDQSRTVGGVTYTGVLIVQDSDPMDDCDDEEEKVYAPGIGEIVDDVLELVAVESPQCFEPTLDDSLCDPETTTFTLESTNPYYPLDVGLQVILEGEEDGETVRVERTVLDETEMVDGVETRILEHKQFVDDEIYEIARNFYVEAADGTVCYFGEDVEFYEDGELVGMQGTWRAGVNGAKPGIIMPANPTVGDAYFQENGPGAVDMGRVSDTDVSRTIAGTDYTGLVIIQDSNPFEDCDEEEEKVYAPGIGEIVDDVLEILGPDSGGVEQVKLLIEHNSTDEDTGFQAFADGEPWSELSIVGPDDLEIVTILAEGSLSDFGITELFFETSEPENAEVPIDDVLSRLAEGTYVAEGELVEGGSGSEETELSHDIPSGPQLQTPEDGASGIDPSNVVVSWQAVTQDLEGEEVEIVGYQVIVEVDAEPEFPQGFARPVLSVHLPASARSVSVPAEFMSNDSCYKYEVLAIEESGNQTLSSAEFETGEGCEPPEEEEDDTPRLTQAKLLIEHNSTDEDTGFQSFADGDPWNELSISGPGDVEIVGVFAEGGLFDFGLTELFFETSEPENAEVPIADVLARLPEGTYTFAGDMVDGEESSIEATFTHDIPAGPVLISPEAEAEDVDPADTVVSWEPVTVDLDGDPINIVGYQVIVEEDAEPRFPTGFAAPVFSVYLPASVTSVKVPAEFMQSDTDYEYEVLAIEESGNQTLTSAEFSTE